MDIEQVKQAQMGKDDFFFQLINSNKEQLYRIAYSYMKNQEEALEAIQETTCRAYQNINKLKEPAYFKTWLIRILINYCIDELKRKNKIVQLIQDENKIEEDQFLEDRITIGAAVEKLKAEHRKVIILKYFEDLTINEISAITNSPTGTVKTRLNRGLEGLRKLLGKKEGFYEEQ